MGNGGLSSQKGWGINNICIIIFYLYWFIKFAERKLALYIGKFITNCHVTCKAPLALRDLLTTLLDPIKLEKFETVISEPLKWRLCYQCIILLGEK